MAEPDRSYQAPAGHPAFPPFQTEHFPSQLVWLAVSFVLLYVLMAKVALPRIGAIFADAQQTHRRRSQGRARLQGAVRRRARRLREGARRRPRPRAGDRRRNPRAAGGRGRGDQQAARSAAARAAGGGGAIDRRDPHRRHGQCRRHRGGYRLRHRRAPDRTGARRAGRRRRLGATRSSARNPSMLEPCKKPRIGSRWPSCCSSACWPIWACTAS